MNLFDADLDQGKFRFGSEIIDLGIAFSGRTTIGIRPEAIRLGNGTPATVSWIENLGRQFLVGVRIGTLPLSVLTHERPTADTLGVSFDPEALHVFKKNAGTTLRGRGDRGTVRP
jgi:ABC-type sugar transport system ATPase subunit